MLIVEIVEKIQLTTNTKVCQESIWQVYSCSPSPSKRLMLQSYVVAGETPLNLVSLFPLLGFPPPFSSSPPPPFSSCHATQISTTLPSPILPSISEDLTSLFCPLSDLAQIRGRGVCVVRSVGVLWGVCVCVVRSVCVGGLLMGCLLHGDSWDEV